MPAFINLSGQRFGLLTVVRRGQDWQDGSVRWLCCCDCKKEAVVRSSSLRSGATKSCGCIKHLSRTDEVREKISRKLTGRKIPQATKNKIAEYRRLNPTVKRIPTCHPSKPYAAKNLCESCYRRKYPKYVSKKPAPCHPDKPLYASGLCKSCYKSLQWRLNHSYRQHRKRYSAGWYQNNKMRIKPKAASNAKRWNSERYDKLFGWSLGTHAKLLEDTTVCDLCGLSFDTQRQKATDHCHDTNIFRGVVHTKCNLAIGYLDNSEEKCLRAAAYLRKHKK